jgi:hypothetical protein
MGEYFVIYILAQPSAKLSKGETDQHSAAISRELALAKQKRESVDVHAVFFKAADLMLALY